MSSQDIFPKTVVDNYEFLNYNKDYWRSNVSRVTAHISYQQKDHRVFHMKLQDEWHKKWLPHFNRLLNDSHEENQFEPKGTLDWINIENRLKKDPRRGLTNADMRLLFRLDNMYLVKHGFTFGQWLVNPGHQHVIQTSFAPMLFYKLPSKDKNSSNEMRRSLVSYHRLFYDRYILPPHGIYRVPEGTRYLLMAVQKTIFALDVVDKKKFLPGSKPCNLIRKYKRQLDYPSAPPSTSALPSTSAPSTPTRDETNRIAVACHKKQAEHHMKQAVKRKSGADGKTAWSSFKIPKKTPRQEVVTNQPVVQELSTPPTLSRDLIYAYSLYCASIRVSTSTRHATSTKRVAFHASSSFLRRAGRETIQVY